MSYTFICPRCLTRQGAPVGGKLVSQEIGGCMTCRRLEVVFVFRVDETSLSQPSDATTRGRKTAPVGFTRFQAQLAQPSCTL